MTPTKLLAEFRRESEPYGYRFGYKALERFKTIEDKSESLKEPFNSKFHNVWTSGQTEPAIHGHRFFINYSNKDYSIP